jgi:hypothetical protein
MTVVVKGEDIKNPSQRTGMGLVILKEINLL